MIPIYIHITDRQQYQGYELIATKPRYDSECNNDCHPAARCAKHFDMENQLRQEHRDREIAERMGLL